MADRLAEMEVRTLSDKLAVLHANAPVGMVNEGPAEVETNTLGNIYFNVETDALVEILSG